MPKEKTIYDDLTDEMESNGEMDQDTKDRYTLLMFKQIGRDISKLTTMNKRIEKLERYSIILFCQRHPKAAAIIAVLILVIINSWLVKDFRKFFLQMLGLPGELVP